MAGGVIGRAKSLGGTRLRRSLSKGRRRLLLEARVPQPVPNQPSIPYHFRNARQLATSASAASLRVFPMPERSRNGLSEWTRVIDHSHP